MDKATLLAIAFVPLSLLAARVLQRFIDPRVRWVSTGAGAVSLLLGVLGAWAVVGDVRDGVVHLRGTDIGNAHVSVAQSPWVFWDEVLLLYVVSLALAGFGIVATGLLRRGRRA